MRAVRCIFVVVLLAELLGCTATSNRVMTASEFAGFCYQAGGRRISCDNISICGEYLPIFDQQFDGRSSCMEACQSVYRRQSAKNSMDSCSTIIPSEANDYCQRYCSEAYPQ